MVTRPFDNQPFDITIFCLEVLTVTPFLGQGIQRRADALRVTPDISCQNVGRIKKVKQVS